MCELTNEEERNTTYDVLREQNDRSEDEPEAREESSLMGGESETTVEVE